MVLRSAKNLLMKLAVDLLLKGGWRPWVNELKRCLSVFFILSLWGSGNLHGAAAAPRPTIEALKVSPEGGASGQPKTLAVENAENGSKGQPQTGASDLDVKAARHIFATLGATILEQSGSLRGMQAEVRVNDLAISKAATGTHTTYQAVGRMGAEQTYPTVPFSPYKHIFEIQATKPLYRPQVGPQTDLARAEREETLARLEAKRQDLILEFGGVFLECISYNQQLKARTHHNLLLKEYVDLARRKIALGSGNHAFLRQASLRLSEGQSQVRDLGGQLRLALSRISNMSVPDTDKLKNLAFFPQFPASLGSNAGAARAANLVIGKIGLRRAQVTVAERAAELEKHRYGTSLDLEVKGTDTFQYNRNLIASSVELVFVMPLFTKEIGQIGRCEEVEKKHVQQLRLQEESEQATAEVRIQKETLENLKEARDGIVQSLELARQLQEIYDRRFREGVDDIFPLLEAEADTYRFQSALVENQLESERAALRIMYETGMLGKMQLEALAGATEGGA